MNIANIVDEIKIAFIKIHASKLCKATSADQISLEQQKY